MSTETAIKLKNVNKKKLVSFFFEHIIEIMLVLLIVVMCILDSSFMTLPNWLNILHNQAPKGIIAFGMTLVIVCGQLDLSIGSTVALSGVTVAFVCSKLAGVMSLTLACIIGMAIAILSAIIFGIIFGSVQQKLNMPSFIITLAAKYVILGIAGVVCSGFPISNKFPTWFVTLLGKGHIGGPQGVSYATIFLFIVFFFAAFFMKKTTTGRALYAAGGNEESARLSGINVRKCKIICFIAVQVLAVVGGFMQAAQTNSAQHTFGAGWENDVIISTVIGGTSMAGGVGSIWGTMMGIIFLGVVRNGLTILNISLFVQNIVTGLLMFLAVFISIVQIMRKNRGV